MIDANIIPIIITAIAIAVISGPLGCLVVWNRLAYFGSSLAHSAMLGIALGTILGINIDVAILIICILFAVAFTFLNQRKILPSDTLLGILAHACFAGGIIIISLQKMPAIDLHDFLFGDIRAVTLTEAYWIIGCAIISLLVLHHIWHSIILISISDDIAKAEGIKTTFTQLLFTLLLTILIAISIRTVGMILVTALLIIPAATGRFFSKTPEQMAIMAVIFGIISSVGGIYGSFIYDTPSGPSIVLAASIIFLVSAIVSIMFKLRR